ncbi:MAG TPA: hypothetical protein VHB27_14285 [Rhodopila sp.]|uniref:hypothetical protein n=1 Tax=Rhodopila sp. TaxID=2480087 RepID=UPI002C9E7CF6|nr:hypothetical protein [Rhodopila sp.]HVY16390.1 hypothetical protein [Rhodopila sp.]
MNLPHMSVATPTGLSFEVPDLLMVGAWAEFHGLKMTIDLDIHTGTEEYEEIVNIIAPGTRHNRWMIWRSAEGIVVQPRMGRPMLFDVMTDALDLLIPASE